jgi:hypothetical protein
LFNKNTTEEYHMTFVYILKKIIGKWINLMAKNNLAQALVMQESPTITLSLIPLNKSADKTICCAEN